MSDIGIVSSTGLLVLSYKGDDPMSRSSEVNVTFLYGYSLALHMENVTQTVPVLIFRSFQALQGQACLLSTNQQPPRNESHLTFGE
jgi:hypothetical protein